MTIPTPLLRTLILRGIVLWILGRLMAIAILAWARGMGGRAATHDLPAFDGPLAWALPMSAALFYVDLLRRKELMLLNNLGVATSQAVLIGSLPALLFEAALFAFRA